MSNNEDFRTRAEGLILQINSGSASDREVELFLTELKTAMRSSPSLGKELGPLIPKINKALNSRLEIPQFEWVQVGNGYLAVGHKPGGKISFEGMKQAGVTAVLTLLQENEGSQQIGQALQRIGIEWFWFPFSAVNPESKELTEEVFNRMKASLDQQGKIYIHCSAGIHRTGMVTYAFLRYLGQDPRQAIGNLARMRKLTAEGATTARLHWGDQFGN